MSIVQYLSNRSPSPPKFSTPPMALSTAGGIRSRVLAALDVDFEEFDAKDETGTILSSRSLVYAGINELAVHKPAILAASTIHNSKESKGSKTPVESSTAKPRGRKVKKEENPLKLPNYSYKDYSPKPTRVYIRHEEEANLMLSSLKGPLGFDLEWRVTYFKGGRLTSHRTALAQVCDHETILLIQLSAMPRFPTKLREILESENIVKLGVNILNDGNKLYSDFRIVSRGLVELGAVARQADKTFPHKRNIVALATMTELYTKKYLYKGPVRQSNWENKLTEPQMEYAANDAHCALMIYDRLLSVAAENAIDLIPSKYTNAVTPSTLPTAKLVPTNKPTPVAASKPTSSTSSAYLERKTLSFVSPTNSTPSVSVTDLDSHPKAAVNPFVTSFSTNTPLSPVRQRPQHIRAYCLWHHKNMPLDQMCATLRSPENPLKESTVISYVVGALQADKDLPYSYDKLLELVKMERGSWFRHRDWVEKQASKA